MGKTSKSHTDTFTQSLLRAGDDIAARQKAISREAARRASRKLPRLSAINGFRFPTLLSAEQCTSELLAAFHATLIEEGSRVADLTAGLGVDIFAISSRASEITAVEIDPIVADALAHNSITLGHDNITIIQADSMPWIENKTDAYDVIFIDPYRRDSNGGRVFTLSDCQPDVTDNLPRLLNAAPTVIIKASPMLDTSLAVRQMNRHAHRVILLGTDTECKELIIICHRAITEQPSFSAITCHSDDTHTSFDWEAHEENAATATMGTPEPGYFLYEPWPATMKGGAFKLMSQRFGLKKIADSTHLYISAQRCGNFPGSSYEIIEVSDFKKSVIRTLRNKYPVINVASRNFPLKAAELEKRLGTRPGGELRLHGTTLHDGRKVMIVSRKI